MVLLHQFLNVVLKAIHQTTVEFVFPVVLETILFNSQSETSKVR